MIAIFNPVMVAIFAFYDYYLNKDIFHLLRINICA